LPGEEQRVETRQRKTIKRLRKGYSQEVPKRKLCVLHEANYTHLIFHDSEHGTGENDPCLEEGEENP
jgi:hypothetical protein